MEYNVVTCQTYMDTPISAVDKLEKQVERYIIWGYKPIGGVCVTVWNGLYYAYQAMIKE